MNKQYKSALDRETGEVRRQLRRERFAAFAVVVLFPLILALIIHLAW